MNTPPNEITRQLRAWSSGDTAALERLIPAVYVDETAAVMQLAPNSLIREWHKAKAWLYRALNKQ